MRAEQLLGNAVLLTQEGYGHLCFQNPSTCVEEAMADYLTELVTPPPERSVNRSICPSTRTSASNEERHPDGPDFIDDPGS